LSPSCFNGDFVGERVADERAHHAERGFFIRDAGKGRDIRLDHLWYFGGHIKPPIAGKAGKHRLFKGQVRCHTTG